MWCVRKSFGTRLQTNLTAEVLTTRLATRRGRLGWCSNLRKWEGSKCALRDDILESLRGILLPPRVVVDDTVGSGAVAPKRPKLTTGALDAESQQYQYAEQVTK